MPITQSTASPRPSTIASRQTAPDFTFRQFEIGEADVRASARFAKLRFRDLRHRMKVQPTELRPEYTYALLCTHPRCADARASAGHPRAKPTTLSDTPCSQ